MSSGINIEFSFRSNNSNTKPQNNPTTRFYLCGDFSGDNHQNLQKVIAIDIDNFDDVIAKLAPAIITDSGQTLTFSALNDFHPDNLFLTPLFAQLKAYKRQLKSPQTAEQASAEIFNNFQLHNPQKHQESTSANIAENKDEMFNRLLGKSEQVSHQEKCSNETLESYISKLLSPYIVADTKPEHQQLISFIEQAMSDLMSEIIHSPKFQALESLWLAIKELIFNEEYEEGSQYFYLVNINPDSLNAPLKSNPSFAAALIAHANRVDQPENIYIIVNSEFTANEQDIKELGFWGEITTEINGQFIAGAEHSLAANNDSDAWAKLRQLPIAHVLSLSYPNVLARLPYGQQYDAIESFSYEEIPHGQAERLLWSNSAFSLARFIVRKHQGNDNTTIEQLPAVVLNKDNEQVLHPCGAVFLSEQALTALFNQGISPLISFHNKNSIRLYKTRTIA